MKELKFVSVESLNKTIDYLLIDKNVFEIDIIIDNLIANSIILNIDIFNIIIILKILYQDNNILIIVEENNYLKNFIDRANLT